MKKLRAVLGDNNSETLMSMFPQDFDTLVTKKDLEAVEEKMATKADLAEVKTDLAAVKTDLAEVKTDLTAVKTDLTEVKTDLLGVKGEIGGVKGDIARLDGRMEQFEERLWDLHEAIRAQARVYVTAIVGGMIGLAGVLTAVSRLG